MQTKDGKAVNVNDKLWLQVIIDSATDDLCTVSSVESMGKDTKTTFQVSPTHLTMYPPTVTMERAKVVGFNFADPTEYAKKAIKLLKAAGDHSIELIKTTFALYTAFTDRDLSGLLGKLNTMGTEVEQIINAIKKEFLLE